MKINLVGTSFRNNQFELPIGTGLELIPDPCGKTTGRKHDDKNAISVWAYPKDDGTSEQPEFFIGYIPKELNQNTFKSAKVVSVGYKEFPDMRTQPMSWNKYVEGAYSGSIQIECEGDFQITTDEGRTYETEGKEYESITSFLNEFPEFKEQLMKWALNKYDSYDDYRNGLNEYAEAGTEMHNNIENWLLLKQQMDQIKVSDSNSEHRVASQLENEAFLALPQNVQTFFKSLGDFEVLEVESRVYDDNLQLAGTGDAVLLINGKRVCFDWKSSKSVQDKHKVQISFYAKNMDCDYACVVCFGAKNKQGYSVSKVDINNGYKLIEKLKEIKELKKGLTLKKK